MKPVQCSDSAGLAGFLPASEGLTLLSACSADSQVLDEVIVAAHTAVAHTQFSGIFVPGYNRCDWLANPHSQALTFFMTPEFRALAPNRLDFRPLRYADILSLLRRSRPQALMCMVSPPNADGLCSFGTTVDFIADLWRSVPIRIAHINPLMPSTAGDTGIPFSELTAWHSRAQPLLTQEEGAPDSVATSIANHITPFVRDGATLQTGLGKIPGAVLRSLSSHRNLRIHSGLIGDAVLDLLEAGALADHAPIIAGVAIGSQRLYDAVDRPAFAFHPVSFTHALPSIAATHDPVAINSAIEVDLFGQAYAELTPKGLMSGPGGAVDFAQGVRAANGLRIVALPSTAGAGSISRIVPACAGAGPVSLGRADIDVIATEFGAADLRDLDYAGRARALLTVAHPNHREALERSWADLERRL